MTRINRELCKFACNKCNNFIYLNEACELVFKKIYPQYAKKYYHMNELSKGGESGTGPGLHLLDNLYRQIYGNGLCGVNKQKNDFANKDGLKKVLQFLNRGNIKCTKCSAENMWHVK
ncbi:conserved Plasmodium protein, unknown function [Plasmodium knowlesi strain H]|uniref:Uncharacterized protein n=3 Tax=Plasmodium knowlesi TaxID=5850 RepID=A0A5K1VB95_PLAKH|nr:conserved Plasmodium protein, unknown function [Plasmodium knowlesi strain H]OTN64817.1 Uncharacterized protein PKNOH_S120122400 [Plasmodium knowlesi]CAA9988090.1 conserved Plasmodium protein, unknown function [Plasmodium knowlesi strain H]SBO19954.1 conserved Plasmodium protein, unknown function [Plasmodium knowlesi strain H]SBO29094.1 conserved Plasmodium protein, unknown function [Plasmodium knowlesi strain H]VVS77564.1 conserved Plasmodium protein, unknown function [Plasmodium knowlesi |eukprot:XP_002259064.1 hypothetical protein, conserved in Plasmodium species [Plasmodium knowlesi strain H]